MPFPHPLPSSASSWSLLAAALALLVVGVALGGLQGGISAALVTLVIAVNRFDTVRSPPIDDRFVPEMMLLARPSVTVYRGHDLTRDQPCLMVLVKAGPRAQERAGAVVAERAIRSLRCGARYAEGMTRGGRMLWVFELTSQKSRRITLIDRTPLAG